MFQARKPTLRSLTFAPVEIFMIRGLVASILGFWPGAPEANGRMDACYDTVMMPSGQWYKECHINLEAQKQ